jgi:hypothetical protein
MTSDFFTARKRKLKSFSLTSTSSDDVQSKYEKTKRIRTIQPSWLKEYPWLRYNKISELYTEEETKNIKRFLTELNKERKKKREDQAYDDFEDVMICLNCREKYYHSNQLKENYTPSKSEIKQFPFIFGATSYRIESVAKHCKPTNTQHVLAMDRQKNLEKEKNNKLSEAQQVKTTLSEAQKIHLQHLFRNMYGVLKEGKPFSDYEFIVRLDKTKGVNIGKTYHNRQGGVDFGMAISEVFLNEFRMEFSSAKFFSIIVDESTDAYRLEQMVIYLRYSINGNIKTRFLAIDNVTRPNALQLTALILKLLKTEMRWDPPEKPLGIANTVEDLEDEFDGEELVHIEDEISQLFSDSDNDKDECNFEGFLSEEEPDDYNNELIGHAENIAPLMVGLTTDGANVLTGRRHSVQQQLKSRCNNFLTYTHCLSHRLQLALKDAASTSKELQILQLFCEQLFVFHRNSTVISAVYCNACKVYGVKGILRIKSCYIDNILT